MNFQNIPRDDKVIKRAFVPKLDALVFFDYKSVEPRLTAYYMAKLGDDTLAQMFIDKIDPYVETAKVIFNTQDVTEEQRQIAKVTFLSQTYGGGMGTLIQQLNKPPEECWSILKSFHNAWPGLGWETRRQKAEVGTLLWSLSRVIEQRGHIKTLWGRQLTPESPHKRLNVLIQGCAADLMRYALINVHRSLSESLWKSHIVSTVHDEIIVDAMMVEVEALMAIVPPLMKYPEIETMVPLEVDLEWSRTTWAEKEAYRATASPAMGTYQ